MKTLIATALVATFVAGSASAMDSAHVGAAQNTLDAYGFSVDAGSLSSAQVSALAFLKVDSGLERPQQEQARAANKIRAILN